MRNKLHRKNDAVITVEATIAFTTFAIIMLTILFLIRIVFVYALVQHQINMAAKEIASYSYIYSAAGAMEIDDNIQSNTAGAENYFNTNIGNIVDGIDSIISLGESASSVAQSDDIDSLITSAEQAGSDYYAMKDKLSSSVDSFKTIVSDPKTLLKSIGSVFLGNATSDLKAYFGGEIVRAMMSSYLEDMNNAGGTSYDPETRLEKLGVVGGLSGIDFSESVFNETVNGQKHCIDIVACYKIKPVAPINIYKELAMMNKVTVKMWVGD